MFFEKRTNAVTPDELARMIGEGDVALVDVREPAEFAAGRIEGAINHPLSQFEPAKLPSDGRRVVLYCAAGRRSRLAVGRCRRVRDDVDTHLAGGIGAWSRSGRAATK